jgi:hypothetical protein
MEAFWRASILECLFAQQVKHAFHLSVQKRCNLGTRWRFWKLHYLLSKASVLRPQAGVYEAGEIHETRITPTVNAW